MYYPDQRYVSELTVIRREALLPEEAIGTIRVMEGKRVDIRDIVANGVIPSRYVILNVAEFFNVRKKEKLAELLQVKAGDVIEENQVIAGKSLERGKRLLSPIKGMVARIEDDGRRVILQELPDLLDVEAGVRGRVMHVEPGRGVIIEAVGAQTQGVWGNGKNVIASFRDEPSTGLETIVSDSLEQRYNGTIVLTRFPLTANGFRVIRVQGITGVIAPSMDSSLIPLAQASNAAILLTEGFGNIRMSKTVHDILKGFTENVVTLDAYMPSRFETRTPEVIININPRDAKPTPPNLQLALREGMTVRVTRAPHLGLTGKVVALPKHPVKLPNGLRVPSARVELISGETADIPVANLEVLGR